MGRKARKAVEAARRRVRIAARQCRRDGLSYEQAFDLMVRRGYPREIAVHVTRAVYGRALPPKPKARFVQGGAPGLGGKSGLKHANPPVTR